MSTPPTLIMGHGTKILGILKSRTYEHLRRNLGGILYEVSKMGPLSPPENFAESALDLTQTVT